jgi:hypothetical protein
VTTGPPATAYLSESYGSGVYTMTTVLIARHEGQRLRAALRDQLGDAVGTRAARMLAPARQSVVQILADHAPHAVVAVEAPYVSARAGREAARARCLATTAALSAAGGARWLTAEPRTLPRHSPTGRRAHNLNRADRRTLAAAQEEGLVDADVSLRFDSRRQEPLLVLPDVIGWLVHISLVSGDPARMAGVAHHVHLADAQADHATPPDSGIAGGAAIGGDAQIREGGEIGGGPETRAGDEKREGRGAAHSRSSPTPPPSRVPDNAGSDSTEASLRPESHATSKGSTRLGRELTYHLAAARAHRATTAYRHIHAARIDLYQQAGVADEQMLRRLDIARVDLMRVEPDLRRAAQHATAQAQRLLGRIYWPPVLPSVISAKANLSVEPERDPGTDEPVPRIRGPYLEGP